MAATKEAIAIVLDVGPSMNQAPPGEETALQTSLSAIQMILQRKLFSESKDEITLVLCGTQNTANELADGESYENVTVARPLGMADWELLQYIQNDIQPSNVSADFLDAMVVAMDTLVKGIQGKRGFGSKRLILFTDVGGEFADDQLDDIIGGFKEQAIEFNVIGPDLEDEDDSDKGAAGDAPNGDVKPKTAQQRAGEAMLRHIIEEVNGSSYSFSEALPALSFFQSRQVRPTAWKCQLEIGADLRIPMAGYIKVKEAKAKSYKNVYAKDPDAAIQRVRSYHLNDDDETEVEKSETVEGHRYGSTLVPFSDEDKDAMKFRAEKGLKVLGFTKVENVRRHQFLGDYCMAFVAEKNDEAAAVAISALVNAMYETNMVAIVRRVYSAASTPRIGCLTPNIKAKYECLYYNELPFMEDVRQFTFGSLPIKEDVPAGTKAKPSDEQLSLMDELIETMDLTNPAEEDDEDENEETEEALKPKLTFNPHLQRLYQCLQHRALNPDDDLPELSPLIAQYLQPPTTLQTRSEETLKKMKKLFKLEDVSKKKEQVTGDNMFKDDDAAGPARKKPKVDDNLAGGMADLTKAKVTEVGTVSPVQDFKAIINTKDQDRFEEACKMMQKRILQIVTDSFGTQFYSKAMDCLKSLRQESVKNGEPEMFNGYLRDLKVTLGEKGRKDFWEQIAGEKLSLITKAECEDSKVSKEEAETFITEGATRQEESASEEEGEDADELLAQF